MTNCCVGRGAKGPKGVKGPVGPQGLPGADIGLEDGNAISFAALEFSCQVTGTLAEFVCMNRYVDMAAIRAAVTSLQALFSGRFSQNTPNTAASVTIRLRTGGTFDVADGTIRASQTFTFASSPDPVVAVLTTGLGAAFARPTGVLLVKLSMQIDPATADFVMNDPFFALRPA